MDNTTSVSSVSSLECDGEFECVSLAEDIVTLEDVESLLNTVDEIADDIDAGLNELIIGYSKLNIDETPSFSSAAMSEANSSQIPLHDEELDKSHEISSSQLSEESIPHYLQSFNISMDEERVPAQYEEVMQLNEKLYTKEICFWSGTQRTEIMR